MTSLAVRDLPYEGWEDVCSVDDVLPDTGVCALVAGRQVAIIRAGDTFYALSNFDPFSKAYVLSRGIVGDRGGVPKIASPIFKQTFDLRSGRCLDDPRVSIPTHEVRIERGRIFVCSTPRPGVTH
jgi:nitrite reductase (NADH) small subunit